MTLRRGICERQEGGEGEKRGYGPSGEGVCALEVELVALLHVALAVTPFVDTVFEVWREDLHGCWERQYEVERQRGPTDHR